jgi:hypothetical protein
VPLHGKTLTSPVSLQIGNESVVLERSSGGQDMKIQAKDCPQGGLFQMEPEPGTRERNTLGSDFSYTSQPPERRGCASPTATSPATIAPSWQRSCPTRTGWPPGGSRLAGG